MKYKGETQFKETFYLDLPEGAFLDVLSYKNWRHRIQLNDKLVSPGYISEYTWYNAHFPTDFKGKSMLDVGANDGLNAFLAERMGATEITAIDIYADTAVADHQKGWNPTAIHMACKYLNSKVQVHDMSIYDVAKLQRRFDVVIVADVITWLHDITGAMRILGDICNETLIIREGFLKKDYKEPVLRYEHSRTGSHVYTPSLQYMREILTELGFKTIEVKWIPISTLYDHWVESFPIIHSDKKVLVYPDPWSKNPEAEFENARDQALMKVGNRFLLRGKGWADADGLREQWIKPGMGARLLRALVGYEKYMYLKDRRYNYPNESYTVIARR